MRKLIVSNLVTLDGYYEDKGRDLSDIFTYFHEDYAGDQNFDKYATESLRAAETAVAAARARLTDRDQG